MTEASGDRQRLGALVGTWDTQGWPRVEAGSPPERIDAIETYEWLPGGAALLHHLVDATVGDTSGEGAEIIGFDPNLGHYRTLYFGTDGPTAYEPTLRRSTARSSGRCEALTAVSAVPSTPTAGSLPVMGTAGRRLRVATVDEHYADETGLVSCLS